MEIITITSEKDRVALLDFVHNAKDGIYSQVCILPDEQIRMAAEIEVFYEDDDDCFCYYS